MNTVIDFSETILIVDDLPENIEILGTVLRKNKYKVAVAMNGEDAVSISKKLLPALILLDISMPGMDGFSVCKTLKNDHLTADIPIIFVTAKVESEDIIKGFSYGAVDYITKPFRSSELLVRLKTHLTIRRLQNELRHSNENLENKVIERTTELQTAKEKAELSDRLKSEFLSQISHEIRTPLNAVISSASLIESEMMERADEFMRPLFESLKSGTKRIIRTVDLILNMAQIHTNTYTLIPEKICLNKIISSAAGKYRSVAKDKNLLFNIILPSDDLFVLGDSHAISEIFEQLIDNAINFTAKGSITLSLSQIENNYIVIVEDTGVGISENFLPQLFAYFSQEKGGIYKTV